MAFELPKLKFSYDALGPFMDSKTVEIHYSKHHKAYADKFNASIDKYPKLKSKSAEEIISDLSEVPADIRMQIANFGGGFVNHNFFWQILAPVGQNPNGKILNAIEKEFGSFDEFKKKFSEKAAALFGSGWTWLVLKGKKLELINTSNQDSPLSHGKVPILALDVWEHAYYLKYQNRRAEFIEAFWNIINWDKVEEIYNGAIKS